MSNLLAFEAFPKIDRYLNETVTITEKIDGTNACIAFELSDTQPYPVVTMSCQSRNRIIKPGDDNAGFAAWAYENVNQLFELFGVGRHYGEWWGKGIQRNYGQDGKRFSPFNTKMWPKDRPTEEVGGVPVCGVPVLCTTQLSQLQDMSTICHASLRAHGSVAAPGFMDPEGTMMYLHRLGRYLKDPLDANHKGMTAGGHALRVA